MTKKELEKNICSTLNIEKLTPTISKQITKFVIERGLKYEDIARAISFYVEVEGEEFKPQFGIAFVEWTYIKANKYYEEQERRKQEQLKSLEKNKSKTNIILKAQNVKRRQPLPKVDIEKLGDE